MIYGAYRIKLVKYRALACWLAISICTSVVTATGDDSPLQKTCIQSDTARIATLVKAGANPNGEGSYRGLPLYAAIKSDDANLVHLLIEKGANPNIPPNSIGGCGPLWFAFDASLSILQNLLDAGANPNCVWADKRGGDQSLTTPLIAASSLKMLRMDGRRLAWTDKPIRKDTPQPVDVVKLLLKYGSNPNARDYFGKNALYAAIDADDIAVARALIEGGLDVNGTIDQSTPGEVNPIVLGQTALLHALGRYSSNKALRSPQMIRLLLEKGANPNVSPIGRFMADCGEAGVPPCSFSGETPLSYVARLGNKDITKLLLDYGAIPDGAREDGAKPVDIAAKGGHVQTATLIARYLTQHKN